MADFVNKQFDKAEVADKVLEQYDQEHTRIFYKYVMGERAGARSADAALTTVREVSSPRKRC